MSRLSEAGTLARARMGGGGVVEPSAKCPSLLAGISSPPPPGTLPGTWGQTGTCRASQGSKVPPRFHPYGTYNNIYISTTYTQVPVFPRSYARARGIGATPSRNSSGLHKRSLGSKAGSHGPRRVQALDSKGGLRGGPRGALLLRLRGIETHPADAKPLHRLLPAVRTLYPRPQPAQAPPQGTR
jgi:hypothetical protein